MTFVFAAVWTGLCLLAISAATGSWAPFAAWLITVCALGPIFAFAYWWNGD